MSTEIDLYDCVRVGADVLGFVVEKHPVAQQVRLYLFVGSENYGTTNWFDTALCEATGWDIGPMSAEAAALSDHAAAALRVAHWARSYVERETKFLTTPDDELAYGDRIAIGLLRVLLSFYGVGEGAS